MPAFIDRHRELGELNTLLECRISHKMGLSHKKWDFVSHKVGLTGSVLYSGLLCANCPVRGLRIVPLVPRQD